MSGKYYEVFINGIDYGLSLYYSYLLPLFHIERRNDKLIFIKQYGYCRGLKCIGDRIETKCILKEESCSREYLEKLLGLEKKRFLEKLAEQHSFARKLLSIGFTLMYSPMDKLHIASIIYLSRNTDYYINTIKWYKIILKENCLSNPDKCRNITRSYQFQEYLEIIPLLKKILHSERNDPLIEAVKLLEIPGFGIKSVMAYLLHTYGLTRYAPIDRYYREFLERRGVIVKTPSKKYCIKHVLRCSECTVKTICPYNKSIEKYGVLNGIIQSLIYIYKRLKTRQKKTTLEKKLIPTAEEVLNELSYIIKYFIRS